MQIQLGKRKGFTLIELLVVISILAILARMLLPALSRAKESAYCPMQGYLKIGIALTLYADDNGGRFPTSKPPFRLGEPEEYAVTGHGIYPGASQTAWTLWAGAETLFLPLRPGDAQGYEQPLGTLTRFSRQ